MVQWVLAKNEALWSDIGRGLYANDIRSVAWLYRQLTRNIDRKLRACPLLRRPREGRAIGIDEETTTPGVAEFKALNDGSSRQKRVLPPLLEKYEDARMGLAMPNTHWMSFLPSRTPSSPSQTQPTVFYPPEYAISLVVDKHPIVSRRK